MRILIIGSGVNGLLAGAALVESGQDVTFLVRPSRQPHLISHRLKIASPFGRCTEPLLAVTPPELDGIYDVVILATRANLYQMGLFLARGAITPETLLVPLIDGVGHVAHWREVYPNNPVTLAVFEARTGMDADGVVRQNGPIGDLQLGLRSPHGAEYLAALAAALVGRRFRATPSAEAMLTRLWARHVYLAAAIGAAQLAGGTPLRDAIRFHSRRPFEDMLDEGTRAGEAHGVPRLREAVRRYRTAFLREGEPVQAPMPIGAGSRASGESLYMLGTMLRQAQDAKVAAPTMQRAWHSVGMSAPRSSGEPVASVTMGADIEPPITSP